MSTTKQVNYVDVIKDIEQFYVDNNIVVNALITTTSLKYKPLSVEQLKGFIELQISTAKDEFGVLTGLQAVDMLNDIIVNNSLDHKEKLLTSLSVLDRDAILLQLRAHVKPGVELAITGSEDNETQSVDLTEITSRIKKAKFPKTLKEQSKALKFNGGTFTVKLKLPSLQVDSDINNKFRGLVLPKLSKGAKHVDKHVDKILSQVYFLELYKYIDTVTINKKDEDETVVNFRDLDNFDQNFLLLDKLPTQIIANISEYMTDVRKYKDGIFYYENDDNKQIPLDVDIGLFAGI
jgi:hypothetical protein